MAEKVVGGLKWVKGEIAMTLRRVRNLVESFARTGEPAELSEAVDALFEVRGVLLALQLTMPARLVDEMQRLCDALVEHRVSSPRESVEALTLALIQLPSHLDQLDAGAEIPPLSLWPTINDLRSSRGAPPVTPAELLVPGSVLAAEEEELSPEALELLGAALRKVRPHFHRHLVEWFGQSSSAEGLVKLSRLFQQLHRFLKDGMLADLFRLAAAHTEALQRGQVAADAAARALVGRLDRVFKPLIGLPPNWPETEIRELLDAYLTDLDQADIQPSLVAEVRAHYTRSALDPVLLPSSAAVMAGLAETMLGELAVLKECLSLFLRGERDDRTPLTTLRSGGRRLAHVLAEAGISDVAERLRDVAEGFGELAQSDATLDAPRLEPLVAALLEIEALFQAQAQPIVPSDWSPAGDTMDHGDGLEAAAPGRPGAAAAPAQALPTAPVMDLALPPTEAAGIDLALGWPGFADPRGGDRGSVGASSRFPDAESRPPDLTELVLSGLSSASSSTLDPDLRDSDLADFFSQVADEDESVLVSELRTDGLTTDQIPLTGGVPPSPGVRSGRPAAAATLRDTVAAALGDGGAVSPARHPPRGLVESADDLASLAMLRDPGGDTGGDGGPMPGKVTPLDLDSPRMARPRPVEMHGFPYLDLSEDASLVEAADEMALSPVFRGAPDAADPDSADRLAAGPTPGGATEPRRGTGRAEALVQSADELGSWAEAGADADPDGPAPQPGPGRA